MSGPAQWRAARAAVRSRPVRPVAADPLREACRRVESARGGTAYLRALEAEHAAVLAHLAVSGLGEGEPQ